MTELADFVVMEPGELLVPDLAPLVPTIPVDLPLGGTSRQRVNVEVSEAGIAEVADVLHRVGGEAMVGELRHALDTVVRSAARDQRQLAGDALGLLEREIVELRRASLEHLEALDASARRAFAHDLTVAQAGLRPEEFGLKLNHDGTVSVLPAEQDDPKQYRLVRYNMAVLNLWRYGVRRWAFPIPPSAARARRDFEESAQEPFREQLATVVEIWPAMNVLAPRILAKLEKENRADVGTWADDSSNETPLDDIVKKTLVGAFTELEEQQPTYWVDTLVACDKAMDVARGQVKKHWTDSPAATLGRLHPLFQHAFLVQAAIEEQGYLPGDHGHAIAMDARAAAVAERHRSRRATAEMDRLLFWSSLGFGLVSIIPVVGQLALLAAITAGAIQAVEETARYLETSALSRALGQQAPDYEVTDPNALGMVVAYLGIASDAALPVVGKLLGKTILAPASRALAAARVAKVLNLGERAADLAGMTLSANAAVVEHELGRLGLLEPPAGNR